MVLFASFVSCFGYHRCAYVGIPEAQIFIDGCLLEKLEANVAGGGCQSW